ncbi:hypothetical protein [Haloechinothrix aidingensis]|nr:hypothetical protein [Haloechinothrix aidingensis]
MRLPGGVNDHVRGVRVGGCDKDDARHSSDGRIASCGEYAHALRTASM